MNNTVSPCAGLKERLIAFFSTKETKTAFFSSVILFFLIHTYCFTNGLLNHDGLFNVYSTQNMLASGRWFLSIACAPSTFFDLPWVIGVFSCLYMALTVAVIVRLFKVKSAPAIILIAGILIAFPAITDTFFFRFTADGYMLAMLLATLAALITPIDTKGIWPWIFSGVLICVTCGIYQAYVSFALVLSLIYFLKALLDGTYTKRQYLLWICKQIVVYAAAMLLYVVIWKGFMAITGVEANSYLGIDSLGDSIFSNPVGYILSIVKRLAYSLIFFLSGWRLTAQYGDITVWNAINAAVILLFVIGLVVAAKKTRLYKSAHRQILFILTLIAIPVAAYIWLFASTEVQYDPRMEQSLSLIYVFGVILFTEYASLKADRKMLKSLGCAVLALFILNSAMMANIFYQKVETCNNKTYAIGVEVAGRIHALDDGSIQKLALSAYIDDYTLEERMDWSALGLMGPLRPNQYLLDDEYYFALYLKDIIGLKLSYYEGKDAPEIPVMELRDNAPVSGQEIRFPLVTEAEWDAIRQTEVYQNAPAWPHKDSVFVLDNVIVVKMNQD